MSSTSTSSTTTTSSSTAQDSQSAHTISLGSAMETLKSMFTTMDDEVLLAVLQEQRGYMERTIEILLEMSGEMQRFEHQHEQNPQPSVSLPPDFLSLRPSPPASSQPEIPRTRSFSSTSRTVHAPVPYPPESYRRRSAADQTSRPEPRVSPRGEKTSTKEKAKNFFKKLFQRKGYERVPTSELDGIQLLRHDEPHLRADHSAYASSTSQPMPHAAPVHSTSTAPSRPPQDRGHGHFD
eukprot:gnl/Trimastix_PCT/2945.p2 GENE.gnl/Trimastix_PCT/2945~~gnl/Trimastix_PCT/2945.p2  ORF type:complete len:257 (-),score=6.23 gnl/Trimastix_PCT/2945:264-974(-)